MKKNKRPATYPTCKVCGDRIRITYGLPVHTKGIHDHAAVK